jgi:beta-galactosidase
MRIVGYGNGDPAFRNCERPTERDARTFSIRTFNGLAQVLLQRNGADGTFGILADGLIYLR